MQIQLSRYCRILLNSLRIEEEEEEEEDEDQWRG
jgi:hypothetical protein